MITKPVRTPISEHILPNSSMMIGVCMTVISIVKLIGLHKDRHKIAEFLAIDSLLFMISAILSYMSMRYEGVEKTSIFAEKIADVFFMFGLFGMTLVDFLLAYEIV